jgi:hypothetical protein
VTFGLAMVAEQFIRMVWGAAPLQSTMPPEFKGQLIMGDMMFSKYRLFILGVVVVVMSGIWLLLQGRPASEALAQLTLRHGHVAAARTGILDTFIAEYTRAWPKPFLQWLREDYDEDRLRTNFRSRSWANLLTDGILRRE